MAKRHEAPIRFFYSSFSKTEKASCLVSVWAGTIAVAGAIFEAGAVGLERLSPVGAGFVIDGLTGIELALLTGLLGAACTNGADCAGVIWRADV